MRTTVLVVMLMVLAGCDSSTTTTKKVDNLVPEAKVAKVIAKPKGVGWAGVYVAANKRYSAVELAGKAEQTLIHAVCAQDMARRIGGMSPSERQDGLLAVRAVEAAVRENGPKGASRLIPEIFNLNSSRQRLK